MASTYEPITTQTLSSSTNYIDFTSIPQTYTDLVIVVGNAKTSVNTDSPTLGFNGDTGTNYSLTYITGNGSTAGSARQTNSSYSQDYLASSSMSSTNPGQLIINVFDYTNTAKHKAALTRVGTASNATELFLNLWRSTAAITTIRLGVQGSDLWQAGTMFTMYGIKAA